MNMRTRDLGLRLELFCALLVGLGVVFGAVSEGHASTISGLPIVGGNPNYRPVISADFSVSGSQLTLVATYVEFDPTGDPISSLGEALAGILFELPSAATITSVDSVHLTVGSQVLGVDADVALAAGILPDLTGEFSFLDGIAADTPLNNFTDAYLLSSVGTALFNIEVGQVIDGTQNITGNTSANGPAFMIVPDELNLSSWSDLLCPGGSCPVPNPFGNQGPMIEDSITAVFNFSGTLDPNQIRWEPLFGTEGAPLIPEPGAVLLFAAGLGVVGVGVWRRKNA
jgi:hypothetical protein